MNISEKRRKVVLNGCVSFLLATVSRQSFSQTYPKFIKNTTYTMDIVIEKSHWNKIRHLSSLSSEGTIEKIHSNFSGLGKWNIVTWNFLGYSHSFLHMMRLAKEN